MSIETRATFTPGPWKVYENRYADGWPCHVLAGADDSSIGTSIIEGAIFVHENPAVNTANMRLVEAATDLYAALQHAVSFLDTIEMYPTGDHISKAGLRKMSLPMLDAARAALAKADGR